MRRRIFLAMLGSSLCIAPAVAEDAPGRRVRIGFLSNYSEAAGQKLVRCFVDALAPLGWKEGANLTVEYRWMDGKPANGQRQAAELVALNLDLIAVNSTQAAQAMRAATHPDGVPVVFMSVSDPVESRIVQSIPRPGANITGVSNFFPANSVKLLELVRLVAPTARRIDILRDPSNQGKTLDVKAILQGAHATGVDVRDSGMKSSDDIRAFFAQTAKPDALIVLVDGVTLTNRNLILGLVDKSAIPAIYQVRDFVDFGGLMSYGLDFCQHFARAASYADKILRGTKPLDLPIEFPTTFQLVINMKTARKFGFNIPAELLTRADELIE